MIAEDEEKLLDRPRLVRSPPDGVIMLIDKQLTEEEEKLLNEYCSTYILTQEDKNKWIDDLPKVDVIIVPLYSCTCMSRGRISAMEWYEFNFIKLYRYTIIYYRTTSNITKKNIPLLGASFIIKSFPTEAKNKADLIDRLSHTAKPYIGNCCSLICSCLFSKISCRDFFVSCGKSASLCCC